MYQPIRCNCLVWALVMRWRHGGYFGSRQTDWAAGSRWWRHYMWSPDLVTWYAYSPTHHRRGYWPEVWFRGRIEINDRGHRERFGLLASWETVKRWTGIG